MGSDRTLVAGILFGSIVGAVLGLFAASVRTTNAAIEANARADSMAVVLQLTDADLAAVTAAHERALAELRLPPVKDTVVVRLRDQLPALTPATPATDTTWKVRSLAQDTIIVRQDSTIADLQHDNRILTADNANLASSLLDVRGELQAAAAELERQSERTEAAPRKLLGLLPLPKLTLGYGATVADGEVKTGPQVTLGWTVSL